MHIRIKEVEKEVPNVTFKGVPMKRSKEYIIKDVAIFGKTDDEFIVQLKNGEDIKIKSSDIAKWDILKDEEEKAVEAIKSCDEAYDVMKYLSKETFRLMNKYFYDIKSPYFQLFWHDIKEVYDNLENLKSDKN